MRTTQQMSFTLPIEMANAIKAKVRQGEYASESEVIREGLRFVRSELAYLWRHAPTCIPAAMASTLAKWVGYKLGRAEARLPLAFKRWCSMHRGYWRS